MSLDGFLTGPDDAMEWVFEYEGPNAVVDEVIRTTGAILAGRRWHDLAIVRWNGSKGIYGGSVERTGICYHPLTDGRRSRPSGHVRFRQSERGRCDRPRGGER